jgi:hypothetical protein
MRWLLAARDKNVCVIWGYASIVSFQDNWFMEVKRIRQRRTEHLITC